MPNRIFINTLFVMALINRRDHYHQQVLDLAEQFEGAPLLVAGLGSPGDRQRLGTEL